MKNTTLLLALTTSVSKHTKTQLHSSSALVRLWAALGLLAALAFAPPPAHAAVTEAWVHRYDASANGEDYANAIALDGSGNVVVTGTSGNGYDSGCEPMPIYDYYTAKYAAADGALLWEKRYNGPANRYDSASAVAADGSGNIVVTGYSEGDYYTAKYAAADGALLWEKRYNGPANSDDFANAVAVDGSGNVVVTGSSIGTNDLYDYYTVKYAAADGALLWERRYNGPLPSYDSANAVAVDGSGNVVVTGHSEGAYYTAKYAAADGALLWEQRGPGGGAASVAVDPGGNVVVTGFSGGVASYYTAKYAAVDGALLWEKRYNGLANGNYATAVAVDGSGNVVVTGSSETSWSASDYYTAKYAAANGALLWERRYNGPANTYDSANAVAVDGSGNVVVTGVSQAEYYTAKYAAADGALLWEQRFVGRTGDAGGARGLALGPNGMVAITGSFSGSSGTLDYATVVYRETLPPVSIALLPDGVRLRFSGVPGRSYTIERAPAVTGPWSTLATPTAPASGLLEYIDTAPHPGSAFYRTSTP